ncbi:MAG: hypothetical protein P8Y53_16145 [Pseudolabrys sp.]
MPRRYSYMTRFRCPKCKKAGTAKWEENERVALPHGTGIATLASLSHGFHSGPHNIIYCTPCAKQVVTGHG